MDFFQRVWFFCLVEDSKTAEFAKEKYADF